MSVALNKIEVTLMRDLNSNERFQESLRFFPVVRHHEEIHPINVQCSANP